jgi:predicted nucleotidyltransferase
MRVTRNVLMKIVRDRVEQRVRADRSLLAIYLCGSLLGEDYLLGGTADIDLVVIHLDAPTQEREIVHLSDEVHLDIAHLAQKEYRQTRRLRVHPWMGPTLFACQSLYDPQHFLDFIQAGVRGQFDRSDYVVERTRKLAESARRLWLGSVQAGTKTTAETVLVYLKTLGKAANAVASLSGPPLTERRLLLAFPARAEAVNRPGLFPGLLGLLGAADLDAGVLKTWLPAWEAALQALPEGSTPARLHPHRRAYYQGSIQAMIDSGNWQAALWPLLCTWTLAVGNLGDNAEQALPWQEAFTQLDLLGEGFERRLEGLDAYLDMVEEVIDSWARSNGV